TTSYTLTGLVAGASYFCAVTAYDPAKKESTSSNQVQFTGPAETSTTSAPVASFAAFPTSGTVPLTVSFANSSTGSVTGWSWNFGDGTSSSSQNPTHTYNTAGTYTAQLTATGPGGTSSSNAPISALGNVSGNCPCTIWPPTATPSISATSD